MSTNRVMLPEGCSGLDLPNGQTLKARELGGAVEVPAPYADRAVREFGKAAPSVGFVRAAMGPASIVCGTCGFHRFAWSDRPHICPRCKEVA